MIATPSSLAVHSIGMTTDMLYRCPTSPLVLSDAPKRRYKKEVIYCGDFEKRNDKGEVEIKFSVTEDTLQHWHNTYLAMSANGIEVPVPVDHTMDPEKKRAVISGSEIAKNEKGIPALFHYIDFVSDEAAAQLSNSDTSIFVPSHFTDGKGRTYHRPIRHVALTDYPVIPGLEKFKPIIASFAEKKPMSDLLKKIAKKLGIAEDVSDDKLEAALDTAIDELLKKVEKAEKAPEPDKDKKKEEPAIAAGWQVDLLKDNRQSKINSFIGKKLTPAAAKRLTDQFCADAPLTLALSHSKDGKVSDGFDAMLGMVAELPDLQTGENTGSQSISLSHQLDTKNNPLLADAERRAKEGAR